MRFSLRTLLLLFALVAVSYALSYLFARSEILGKIAQNCSEFEAFQNSSEAAMRILGRGTAKVDLGQLNSGMQGQVMQDQFSNFYLEHRFFERNDAWGNPLHWVALDENNQPLPAVQFADKFGIYSTGPDGISKTAGNDPDDYNTWNTTADEYHTLIERGHTHQIRMRTLQTMPGMFFLLLVGVLLYQNRHRFRRQPIPFNNRDDRPWAER